MYRKAVLCVAVGACVVGSQGCATILTGTCQSISIRSNPADAAVKIYNKRGELVVGAQTPTIATLKRGKGYFIPERYKVIVSKSGYETKEFVISAHLNGWYMFGNFVFGGALGYLVVDPISGAMWTLSPEKVTADLHEELAALGTEKGLMVVLREDISEELAQHLNEVRITQ